MLKTADKKIYHRHTWKRKDFALRTCAFEAGAYVGPRLDFSCDGEPGGSYLLHGCSLRSFDDVRRIWVGQEARVPRILWR